MQRSLGAVKVAPDRLAQVGLFGIIRRELAVFPGDRQAVIKLINDGLMVGGIGGLLMTVVDDRALNGSAAAGENVFRRLQSQDPSGQVQPVDSPVSELAIGVIEEHSESPGMDEPVEWAHRRGTAPEIPIQALGAGVFAVGSSGPPA